jgi:hypothetical protein
MTSQSETGHAKNVANFENLLCNLFFKQLQEELFSS